MCLLSNFGKLSDIKMRVYKINGSNKFSLKTNGAFNAINATAGSMKPLQNGRSYQLAEVLVGCANTVLPSGASCNTNATSAVYREFTIADSGIVNLNNLAYP